MSRKQTGFKLFLVRHASYDDSRQILPGRLPVPLSKTGRREAKKLKSFFSQRQIETIYSSAVLRCRQTAEIISGGQAPVIYDQRLLEVFSAYQGYWQIDWAQFYCHRHKLGGENNRDVQKRIVDFYQKTKFGEGKEYIICSHGDPLHFLYQYLAKLPLLADDIFANVDNYQPKGSIRPVEVNKGKVLLKKLILQAEL